ncbi:AEC family transporter [Oscillospiraceae bacterium CM]|nr:AEC family transporter [Oscillospiraceae bacterium CM]
MNMSAVISQMAVLFLILVIGFTANKLHVLNADSNKLLSKLVLNIALPCTILNSVMNGQPTASGSDAALFMGIALVMYAIFLAIALPVPTLLRAPDKDRGITRFMLVFGNVGYMGFPVVETLFGSSAVFYVALVNMLFGLLCFSFGILMISGRGGKINPRLFLNPALFASAAAIVIFVLRVHTPGILANTADVVGRLTTPCAMLIIGSTLAEIPFKEVFGALRLYPFTVIKLLIIPLLTWAVLRLFVTDTMMLRVLVVLAAMPSATNATMMSFEYGGNEKLAAEGVFMTTLFSIVTIPFLVYILFSGQ